MRRLMDASGGQRAQDPRLQSSAVYSPARALSGAHFHRDFMTHHAGSRIPRIARVVAFAVALCVPYLAFADDYADVNQLMKSGKYAQALAKADQYLVAKPRDPQM